MHIVKTTKSDIIILEGGKRGSKKYADLTAYTGEKGNHMDMEKKIKVTVSIYEVLVTSLDSTGTPYSVVLDYTEKKDRRYLLAEAKRNAADGEKVLSVANIGTRKETYLVPLTSILNAERLTENKEKEIDE